MKRGPIIALLIAVVAILWIVSGQVTPMDGEPVTGDVDGGVTTAEAVLEPGEVVVPSVRTLTSIARPRVQIISLFGRTEADRYVDIRAETDGQIVALKVAEGDSVDEGAPIARIAVNDRQARVNNAKAQVTYREVAYIAAEELSKKQYRSEVKLAEELAALETAKAELIIARVELARTRIDAPFSGVVEALEVEHGKLVQAGDAIVRIDDLDPIIVSAQITEREIAQVELGQQAQINLASGEKYSGAVGYISRTANTETRTFRIEISVPNPNLEISAGLTAEVGLLTKPVMAHQISPALLTLDDAGRIGVKTVDGNDMVTFFPVVIIADTTSGVWVTGLPNMARVISVGQEFVLHGQAVRPVNVDS